MTIVRCNQCGRELSVADGYLTNYCRFCRARKEADQEVDDLRARVATLEARLRHIHMVATGNNFGARLLETAMDTVASLSAPDSGAPEAK